MYPYTSWTESYVHSAFENAAATCSGVEACYKALKKQGKVQENFKFITFGGDGGTYDIGFQSLSGAMERGHDMVYVCYDNEAYMNTGIQRSSSTPRFADATTAPVGSEIQGKQQDKKDLTAIMVAHGSPMWRNLLSSATSGISMRRRRRPSIPMALFPECAVSLPQRLAV